MSEARMILTEREIAEYVQTGVPPERFLDAQTELWKGVIAGQMRELMSARQIITLAKWREALPHIHDANNEHLCALQEMYMSAVITPERLLKLVSSDRSEADMARIDIEERAGFLHPESAFDLQNYLPPSGICKILTNGDGKPSGFYSILRDPDCVRASAVRQFGWEPDRSYTKETLPTQAPMGEMSWTNPDAAIHMFELIAAGKIALPGDLVIAETIGDVPFRNSGKAKALKVAAYTDLPEDHYTVTMIFELVDVDHSGSLPPRPVSNLWSRQMNQNLGAIDIGSISEEFTRKDGITLKVRWHLFYSHVSDVLSRAQRA